MWGNVPDDWNMYYRKCMDCGGTYHESEGGCGCYEERKEHLWDEVVERLRHSTIDGTELETARWATEDDLGDSIRKGGLQMRIYITEDDGQPDELIFSEGNWEELKPVIGYVDPEDEE